MLLKKKGTSTVHPSIKVYWYSCFKNLYINYHFLWKKERYLL